MNESTKTQNFLFSKVGELDAQTQADIMAKNVQAFDADMYLRVDITGGSGIMELLDENTTKTTGITNWDKNKLAKTVNMALERVRVAYATTATAGGEKKPEAVKYSTVSKDVPAALMNADLIILQNDKTLAEIPMSRFFVESASNRPAGVEDAVVLDSLRLIQENQPVGIQIKFPKGVALPDANHFVDIRLIGQQTRRR
jgi:hypothetical protein